MTELFTSLGGFDMEGWLRGSNHVQPEQRPQRVDTYEEDSAAATKLYRESVALRPNDADAVVSLSVLYFIAPLGTEAKIAAGTFPEPGTSVELFSRPPLALIAQQFFREEIETAKVICYADKQTVYHTKIGKGNKALLSEKKYGGVMIENPTHCLFAVSLQSVDVLFPSVKIHALSRLKIGAKQSMAGTKLLLNRAIDLKSEPYVFLPLQLPSQITTRRDNHGVAFEHLLAAMKTLVDEKMKPLGSAEVATLVDAQPSSTEMKK